MQAGRVPLVSANDALTSWFFREMKSDTHIGVANVRSRQPAVLSSQNEGSVIEQGRPLDPRYNWCYNRCSKKRIHSSEQSMVTEAIVLQALSVIIDPDFKKDIVSLGFIKNLRINSGLVSFDIELTTPACPVKTEFQRAAERAVMALEGVESVNVNMTARRTDLGNQVNGLQQVAAIIAVASCKGGVGKSTVAAHVARELARRGHKTGLLDADLFGPSVPTLFQLHHPDIAPAAQEGMVQPCDYQGLKIMSFGFFLGNRPAVMRGPMVSGHIQSLLQQVDWGELDYLIVDMPPGTGDVQLTITQTVQMSGAVIVTTRQALSLVDVEKGIQMFEKVNVPMLGLVENMAYFVCDGCDKQHFIFGDEKPLPLQERYGLETLAHLPIQKELTESLTGDQGHAIVEELVDQMVRALGKQNLAAGRTPEVTYDEARLHIRWADGSSTSIDHHTVRAACPCAECVHEYTGEALLDPHAIARDIQPKAVQPLGNYAVQITWTDDHSHGIYSYALLKKLSEEQPAQPPA